jgi:hypothetical protein
MNIRKQIKHSELPEQLPNAILLKAVPKVALIKQISRGISDFYLSKVIDTYYGNAIYYNTNLAFFKSYGSTCDDNIRVLKNEEELQNEEDEDRMITKSKLNKFIYLETINNKFKFHLNFIDKFIYGGILPLWLYNKESTQTLINYNPFLKKNKSCYNLYMEVFEESTLNVYFL